MSLLNLFTFSHFLHRLPEVGDDVFDRLDADGEADEVGCHACLAQLFVGELTVGVAGRVEDAGAGIGHVGDDADEVEVVHELDGILARALQTKSNYAAGAVGHVLLCQGMVLVGGQTGVVHPRNLGVAFQPFGDVLGILAVAWHTQVEGLQPEVEQESILRRGNGTEVAHQLGYEFRGVSPFAEGLGVGQAVVTLVGGGKAGEDSSPRSPRGGEGFPFVRAGFPIELATIDDGSAHLCGVSVHVLRGGVGDDVAAPLEGAEVDVCGKSFIDNEVFPAELQYASDCDAKEDKSEMPIGNPGMGGMGGMM